MKTLIIRMYGLYLNMLGYVAPGSAGLKGFLLFCRPFRLPISQKQKEFFNTADRFTLDHEGYMIQGYKWGNGSRKLLFLHGWQSHTYRWKAYIEALRQDDFTIYALDAPGHGLSGGNFLSVPLYSSLIGNFIKEKGPFTSVVAHSLGGFTLLYTLYKYPLLPLSKVILMAPPGEASDFIDVFQKTLNISNRTLQLITDHFVSRYDVTPEYFSIVKFAENLNVKGLIIHDEEDVEAPYRYSVPLSQVWGKSRLVTTKGFGHNLRSASVVKEVVDFVSEPVHQHHSMSETF
jgi:pimeloyl-ACP methyl ester carboxylesterase